MNLNNTELYKIILDVLETFEHSQLNIASSSGRQIVAEDVHDAVHAHISQIVEDIVCPGVVRNEDGTVTIA